MAEDDRKQLCLCMAAYIDYPKEFQSKIIVDTLITKLTGIQCNQAYSVLGKYYLKYEKVRTDNYQPIYLLHKNIANVYNMINFYV